MEQNTNPEDRHIICGKLIRSETRHPQSGILVLLLEQVDGRELEVLVYAESMLQQLATLFGSVDAAVGQQIELSLDVFGIPVLRLST